MRATEVRQSLSCFFSVRCRRARAKFQLGVAGLELLPFERLSTALQFQIQPDGAGSLGAALDLRQQSELGHLLRLRGGAFLVAEHAERNPACAGFADDLRIIDAAAFQPVEQAAFTRLLWRTLEVQDRKSVV